MQHGDDSKTAASLLRFLGRFPMRSQVRPLTGGLEVPIARCRHGMRVCVWHVYATGAERTHENCRSDMSAGVLSAHALSEPAAPMCLAASTGARIAVCVPCTRDGTALESSHLYIGTLAIGKKVSMRGV